MSGPIIASEIGAEFRPETELTFRQIGKPIAIAAVCLAVIDALFAWALFVATDPSWSAGVQLDPLVASLRPVVGLRWAVGLGLIGSLIWIWGVWRVIRGAQHWLWARWGAWAWRAGRQLEVAAVWVLIAYVALQAFTLGVAVVELRVALEAR